MATYAIGDIQGCYDTLRKLLDQIQFNPDLDTLWSVGDLVNRGPDSLATLRFISQLPHVVSVLGNHDLFLLALAQHEQLIDGKHNLNDILTAPDRNTLLSWLQKQPLLHVDNTLNYCLVHAGIPPQWDINEAKQHAQEVEKILQGNQVSEFLSQLLGEMPNEWHDSLKGWDRARYIVNAFTRMRFIDKEGRLNLKYKGPLGSQPSDLIPWYQHPHRKTKHTRIIFGHWAALEGKVKEKNIYALDTGCVWGGPLTAMRLEDSHFFRSNVTNS